MKLSKRRDNLIQSLTTGRLTYNNYAIYLALELRRLEKDGFDISQARKYI